jgi:hypothetical protein
VISQRSPTKLLVLHIFLYYMDILNKNNNKNTNNNIFFFIFFYFSCIIKINGWYMIGCFILPARSRADNTMSLNSPGHYFSDQKCGTCDINLIYEKTSEAKPPDLNNNNNDDDKSNSSSSYYNSYLHYGHCPKCNVQCAYGEFKLREVQVT